MLLGSVQNYLRAHPCICASLQVAMGVGEVVEAVVIRGKAVALSSKILSSILLGCLAGIAVDGAIRIISGTIDAAQARIAAAAQARIAAQAPWRNREN